jgi:hypothetical protein
MIRSKQIAIMSLSMVALLSWSVFSYAEAAQSPPISSKSGTAPAEAKSKSTKTSVAKKLEPKPVLDEDAQKLIESMIQKLPLSTQLELNQLSDSLHLEDRAVFNELRDDEEDAISDIGMLWQAAVERSGTIRYAIEKLSRRDATGKPVEGDSFTKRALQNLVHLGGVAGSMWAGTPAGLIGSNMIQDIISGSPQDSALSRVTDADMVILAKEVETLQSELIRLYYQYRHAKERLELSMEASSTVGRYYDRHMETHNQDSSTASLQPLLQSLYDSIRQDTQSAQQAYNSARTALALIVGPEAIAALEESKNNTKASRD